MISESMHLRDNTEYMDERSFKRFVESHSGHLLYYAEYLLHSKEEAEEVVSDVFVDVWQSREGLARIRNMKAWLLTLVRHKAISCIRKKKDSGMSVSWEEMEGHELPADLQSPDEHIISREEMSRINKVINALPPRCKQVFVLAKIERLPYKEIAAMLDISVKTINVHVATALRLIAAALN